MVPPGPEKMVAPAPKEMVAEEPLQRHWMYREVVDRPVVPWLAPRQCVSVWTSLQSGVPLVPSAGEPKMP